MRDTLSRRSVPSVVHDVLRAPGEPLDAETRRAYEPRFHHDFSSVRVHAGPRAEESAGSVGALAYAAGNHVVLGAPSVPREVLAHELAHVAQHRGASDVLPQRIAPADAPAEIEAGRGSASVTHDGGALHLYRKKGSFSSAEITHGGLVEEEFKDPKTQPWIETIDIHFTGTTLDDSLNTIPVGTVTATYFANAAALPPVTMAISGGSPEYDLTHVVKGRKVTRIEGFGYNDRPFPKGEGQGPRNKYAKLNPASGKFEASMHYAMFFKGGQALHGGSLTAGSHACVHAEDWEKLRQINYHTVRWRTVVNVDYTPAALTQPCCELFANRNIKRKGDAPQPCNTIAPATCAAGVAAP
jgi:hypothetical protein